MLALSMARDSWSLPSSNTPQGPTVPKQCWPLPPRGGRVRRAGAHRVGVQPHVRVHVCLGLGLDSQLRLQDLLHWHVLVGAAGGLHLVLVPVLAPLPFLLHGCGGRGRSACSSLGSPLPSGPSSPAPPSQGARQGHRAGRAPPRLCPRSGLLQPRTPRTQSTAAPR